MLYAMAPFKPSEDFNKMGNTQRQPSPMQATVAALAVKYDPLRRTMEKVRSRGICLTFNNATHEWQAHAPEPRSRRNFHMSGSAPSLPAALSHACDEWEQIMAHYAIDEQAEVIADELSFNMSCLRQLFEAQHADSRDGHNERTTADALDYIAALPPRNYSQEDN